MEVQTILDYVAHTPYNTNFSILKQMLEELKEDEPPVPPTPAGLEWESIYTGTCELTPGMFSAGSNTGLTIEDFKPTAGKLYKIRIHAVDCHFGTTARGGISFADAGGETILGFMEDSPIQPASIAKSFKNFVFTRSVPESQLVEITFLMPEYADETRAVTVIAPYIDEESQGTGNIEIFEAEINDPE